MSYPFDAYRAAQPPAGPQMITAVDPYVYQALQKLTGKGAVVETVRGSVRGIVKDVKPDHLVVDAGGSPFFIRIQQIVWIMPY